MPRLEREDLVRGPSIFLWSVLGFQAGFVNSFGFLALGRYVSHVTGIGTQIGGAIAGGDFSTALELLGFPLSFIAGSFCSAFFTSARLERGKRPYYGAITLAFPVILLGLLVAGWSGQLGAFGELPSEAIDLVPLFLLSFLCGMQNGCFATLTKGQIRTTHLTGISTDIGTDFARLWFGKLSAKERRVTRGANLSRISTFLLFTFGAVLAVLVAPKIGYSALAIPCASSIVSYFAIRNIRPILDLRYRRLQTKLKAVG